MDAPLFVNVISVNIPFVTPGGGGSNVSPPLSFDQALIINKAESAHNLDFIVIVLVVMLLKPT